MLHNLHHRGAEVSDGSLLLSLQTSGEAMSILRRSVGWAIEHSEVRTKKVE